MSLFSSIQAEKYRGYTFTGVNKPLLARGERSFHARLRTPVDPDGISFSTDLAGPCRLLIRNSIPRITLPAALLRLGIASATNLVTPGCPCPAFPIELSARSTSFYSISPPFLRVGWSRCECWKPGKFPSSILLLFFFFFFISLLLEILGKRKFFPIRIYNFERCL